MNGYWSKLSLTLALIGTSLTLSAGVLDTLGRWWEGESQKPYAAEALAAIRGYGYDQHAGNRVEHWRDVVSAFRRCGPGENSESMSWAKRNLNRAEAAHRAGPLEHRHRRAPSRRA